MATKKTDPDQEWSDQLVTLTHPDTDLIVQTTNAPAYVLGGWTAAPAATPTTTN